MGAKGGKSEQSTVHNNNWRIHKESVGLTPILASVVVIICTIIKKNIYNRISDGMQSQIKSLVSPQTGTLGKIALDLDLLTLLPSCQ